MTITLGSVTLNQHISWRNRFSQINPGRERLTLHGRLVIQRLMIENNDIVLEAIEEDNIRKGYFLQSQLVTLNNYKISGEVIVLNYHGESVNVIILHDGINVEKVLWKSTYTADEKYIGSIYLKRF